MEGLFLLLFGLAVGVLSGLLGIGGGIALVPGLMFLFRMTQQQAQGTSLAVLIPPIGIFAAIVYWQNGYVRLPVVGWVAGGFVVGAYFGAKLVPYAPDSVLRVGFGLLLLYVGFLFVATPVVSRSAAALPAGVAAVLAAAVGLIVRRFRGRDAAPPARDDVDYHI